MAAKLRPCCIVHLLELGRHNVNKVHVCKIFILPLNNSKFGREFNVFMRKKNIYYPSTYDWAMLCVITVGRYWTWTQEDYVNWWVDVQHGRNSIQFLSGSRLTLVYCNIWNLMEFLSIWLSPRQVSNLVLKYVMPQGPYGTLVERMSLAKECCQIVYWPFKSLYLEHRYFQYTFLDTHTKYWLTFINFECGIMSYITVTS